VSRIALQTWGSEGDVRPFLALASALARRGHEVRLAVTDPSGRQYKAPAGVRLEHAGAGAALPPAELDAIGQACLTARSPLAAGRLVIERLFTPFLPVMLETACDLAAWADVCVRHYFLHPAAAAAEAARTADIALHPAPDNLPTRAWPPTGMPHLGALFNALGWWFAARVTDTVLADQVERVRARLGLAPAGHVLRRTWTGRAATLVAASPVLCPDPGDWPDGVIVTGHLRDPGSDGDRPASALEDFLAAGAPPVYASFGSLFPRTDPERARLVDLFTDAARHADCRLVIQAPGAADPGAPGVLVTGRNPHAQVLPRCAGVVHHGGAGIVHTTAAAGTPAVVVPHLFDQFFWATRLWRLGLAGRPLPRRRLHARVLAVRLRQAREDRRMHARAGSVARLLQDEDGTAIAVRTVEAAIGRRGAAARA